MATDVMTQTRQKDSVRVWRLHDEIPGEVRLCVHSEAHERTQRSMLTAPRLREQYKLVSSHYDIEVKAAARSQCH